ncbi:MAG: diguanylate cyclase, partial [Clostridia bacterium]|nr:diguanylate cyclase [Clostridia bacterium]
MTKFIIKRLLMCTVILFFVMLIVYLIMYSLPSSYVETMARELAAKPGSQKSADQWIAELNAQYGMDKGVIQGYLTWLKSAVKGDFGDSWV